MTIFKTLTVLFAAALLEAGGDALIRKGLDASASLRIGFMTAGAVILFAYGWLVNTPPWDFGRLLGVYVVFFFVVAQIINWAAFGQVPSGRVVLGGACIIVGGLIISGSQV
jgi:drug/metabolite transporter superfamily protein YnfA